MAEPSCRRIPRLAYLWRPAPDSNPPLLPQWNTSFFCTTDFSLARRWIAPVHVLASTLPKPRSSAHIAAMHDPDHSGISMPMSELLGTLRVPAALLLLLLVAGCDSNPPRAQAAPPPAPQVT